MFWRSGSPPVTTTRSQAGVRSAEILCNSSGSSGS